MTTRENPTTDHPYRGFQPSLDGDNLCVPYTGQARLRLAFTTGLAHGRIVIDPAARELITIRCGDDLQPRLVVTTAEIALAFHVSFGDWLRGTVRPSNRDVAIVLHPAVEWTLAIRDGLAHSELDLAAGKLARIEIHGGCSDLRCELPPATTAVSVRISGGASKLAVRRPGDTGVVLATSGGIAALRFDDQRFDAIGGSARLETRNLDPGAPRYDLMIDGGASDLTIDRAVTPW